MYAANGPAQSKPFCQVRKSFASIFGSRQRRFNKTNKTANSAAARPTTAAPSASNNNTMKKNKQRPHPAHPAATKRRKFQTSGIAGDKGSKGKASMPAILSVFWQFRMEESRQVRRRCARIFRFDRKFSLHERRPPYLTLRDEGEGFLTIRARARGRGLAAPSLFVSMRGRITWPSPPKITGTSSATSTAVVLDLKACPRRSRS